MSGYKRILLKLSGEALVGDVGFGVEIQALSAIAREVKAVHEAGVEPVLVIGGGNLFRGAELVASGLGRATGDEMGMLATLINALAMRDRLQQLDVPCRAMSNVPVPGIVETYNRVAAQRHLESGECLILCGGTANPFFTTDSAACVRGIELGADLVLKATKVDGVYSEDPSLRSDAKLLPRLTYDEVLDKRLTIMDLTAICLCRDHGMPVRVFSMHKEGALVDMALGAEYGTLITATREDS